MRVNFNDTFIRQCLNDNYLTFGQKIKWHGESYGQRTGWLRYVSAPRLIEAVNICS